MPEADFEHLLTVLSRAILALPGPRRTLEDRLGIGRGNIDRLLDGRMEMRVRHILALARELEVAPGDFFALGCPGATENARYLLADRLAPARPPARGGKTATVGAASAAGVVEELRPLLRQLIREELAAALPPSSRKRGLGLD
jgi:hypothetical protein